jgi:CheY-specific phosphatase CheX
MIIGNLKTFLEERLGSMAISIPTVVFGRNYMTRSVNVLQWNVVPLRCGDKIMEVRFCLMPASAQGNPMRSEHMYV